MRIHREAKETQNLHHSSYFLAGLNKELSLASALALALGSASINVKVLR